LKVTVDNELKFWQLLKLAAVKFSQEYQLDNLVFLPPDVAECIIFLQHAIKNNLSKQYIKMFDKIIVEKIIRIKSLEEIKKFEDHVRLWMAAPVKGGDDYE